MGRGLGLWLPAFLVIDLATLGSSLTQQFVAGPFPLFHDLIPSLNAPRAFEEHPQERTLIHGG